VLNQIELVKQDVSKLRGDIETLRHLNATVEQRQKDLYQDLDGTLNRRKVSDKQSSFIKGCRNTSSRSQKAPSDQEVFDQANQLLNGMKIKKLFKLSLISLNSFPIAHYYQMPNMDVLANAQFNLKNYKASVGTYQKLLDQHPDFAKNPEALLGLANAQIQLALISEAKA
jgi:TolA-binding protein